MALSNVWLLGFVLMTQLICGFGLSKAKVPDIVQAIEQLINASFNASDPKFEHPILGTVVRLAFHDCAGQDGCDGCLNASLPENGGLDDAIDLLEVVYQQVNAVEPLSRADFWALSGIVAVNLGIRNIPGTPAQPKPAVPPLLRPENFTWGRKDCASGNPKDTTDNSSDFPGANLGTAGVLDFFFTRFGFNQSQTVAIMGAHNLGRAHAVYSGFNESWTATGKVLGNEYYASMSNAKLAWVQAPATNGNLQWQPNATLSAPAAPRAGAPPPPPAPKIMMLDADMALFKDIGVPAADGRSKCPYAACAAAKQASNTVASFAKPSGGVLAFLKAFENAFTLMLGVCGRTGTGAATKVVPCQLAKLVQ